VYFEHGNEPQKELRVFDDSKKIKKAGWKKKNGSMRILRKTFFLAFSLCIFVIFCFGIFFLWKAHNISKRININPQNSNSLMEDMRSAVSSLSGTNKKQLSGEKDGRINVLLLGAAGQNNPGKNLTDTVMVMSIDCKNKKLALLSLPRDLYVSIPNDDHSTKINNIYQYGLSSGKGAGPIKETVEKITSLPIHYYLIVDFDAFTKIINHIGGINVYVEKDILDTRYPGPNYSYETFQLSQGMQVLDGATALKYVRERHDDPEGDFGRAKRQQQVIQAVKNKLFSAQTLLNVLAINNILNTLGDNVKTDIQLDDLERFIELSRVIDTQNIGNVVIDAWKKESLLKVSHVTLGNARAFVLVPRVGNFSEIQEAAENIFNSEIFKKRQEQINQEAPTITIVNRSKDDLLGYKLKDLLTDSLSFKDVYLRNEQDEPDQSQTFIQDNTGGKKLFSLDELIKKIPAKLSNEQNILSDDGNENTDFIIFIGNDLIEPYSFEKDSMEDMEKSRENQEDIDLLY
jgi:LCP family protein required for cell wall assembly